MDVFQVPEWQEKTSKDDTVSCENTFVDTVESDEKKECSSDSLDTNKSDDVGLFESESGSMNQEPCEESESSSANQEPCEESESSSKNQEPCEENESSSANQEQCTENKSSSANQEQCAEDESTSTNQEQGTEEKESKSLELLEQLNDKIDEINMLFVQKIQHTEYQEKIVDRMHAELQKYKEDMYAQLVRPILLDLIEMRDSITRVSGNFALKEEEERFVPLKTFSDYTFDIQDILEKNNVIVYDSKEGDDFNALKHRAIKKITTPVEELHGKIAESLSSGYEYLGKTISPEKVIVYIYQKPEDMDGGN